MVTRLAMEILLLRLIQGLGGHAQVGIDLARDLL